MDHDETFAHPDDDDDVMDEPDPAFGETDETDEDAETAADGEPD